MREWQRRFADAQADLQRLSMQIAAANSELALAAAREKTLLETAAADDSGGSGAAEAIRQAAQLGLLTEKLRVEQARAVAEAVNSACRRGRRRRGAARRSHAHAPVPSVRRCAGCREAQRAENMVLDEARERRMAAMRTRYEVALQHERQQRQAEVRARVASRGAGAGAADPFPCRTAGGELEAARAAASGAARQVGGGKVRL